MPKVDMQMMYNSVFCLLLCLKVDGSITKTRLFKYIEKFTTKNWKFSD